MSSRGRGFPSAAVLSMALNRGLVCLARGIAGPSASTPVTARQFVHCDRFYSGYQQSSSFAV